MGEVISFNRVSDQDIFTSFEAQTPTLPAELDEAITRNATRAVGVASPDNKRFRNACIVVGAISIVAAGLVQNTDKSVPLTVTENVKPVVSDAIWRQSKNSWSEYIATLEQDPKVVQLNEEKRLFQLKFGR